MNKTIIFILLILLISSKAFSRDNQGSFYISGLGAASCFQHLKNRNDDNYKEINSNWVSGFISAINMHSDNGKTNILGELKVEDVLHSIDQHCKTYPMDYIPSALTVLLDKLEK